MNGFLTLVRQVPLSVKHGIGVGLVMLAFAGLLHIIVLSLSLV
jgi:hypothetical protein